MKDSGKSRTPNFNVTGAWLEGDDPGERKFQKIGFLLLENGETVPDITIAYQVGELSIKINPMQF